MPGSFSKLFALEHPFWLAVLRDHAQFIRDSFAPKEQTYIAHSQYFLDSYQRFLQELPARVADPVQSTAAYRAATVQLIQWKQNLLEEQMQGKVTLHLPPTFIDHMAREATEYVTVIDRLSAGRPLSGAALAIHSHLLWLPDAMGHAGGIRANLDLQEIREFDRANQWVSQFQTLYVEALEIASKFRRGPVMIPSFQRFTRLSAEKITLFWHYLVELKELVEEAAILSTLHPLMPDHMARESAYYCHKITDLYIEKNVDSLLT
ncbi:MAG: hypothetical protein JWN30_802 [Bacilli bacterium]|nr:hypothetical protein [Bacilli bacterium]